MKAERVEPKQEFVPVIVTLENQEEVDALFTVANHMTIVCGLRVIDSWYDILLLFASNHEHRQRLWNQLNDAIK